MTILALAGDVMLGRGVNAALAAMTPEEPWGDLLPLLRGADATVVNLECAVTARREPWTRTPKTFYFRADPSAVAVLAAAGVDAVTLANNHTLDFEEAGLLDTLAHLDAAGIAHAGAGRDLEAARQPAILEAGDTRIAVVAATDNEPDASAGPDRPGTNYLPVSLDPVVLESVEVMVGTARDAGAEVVVFSNHWGPNMVERPSEPFRAFAQAVIDRGADVYYGHSAHVVQGIEVYRDRPILYDTGDLLDDYAVNPVLRNDRSCLFRLTIEEGGVTALDIVPVTLSYARVELARGDDRDAILERVTRLSAEFGTSFVPRDGRLELPLGGG